MDNKKNTNNETELLQNILQNTKIEDIDDIFEKNKDLMIKPLDDFYNYMKEKMSEKQLKEVDVFGRAEIDYKYGNKILTGQRPIRQRDTILRICLAMQLTLDEIQRAIKLYGLEPLYAKRTRDAIIMVLIQKNAKKIIDIKEFNKELTDRGERPLKING